MTDTTNPVRFHENRGLYTFSRLFFKVISALFFKLDVQGLDNIPQQGSFILTCNHMSSWDIIVIALRVKRTLHYMAKSEYARNTFVRWLFKEEGSFFVDRGEGDTDAIRNCLTILHGEQILVIFPEGHRSENNALIQAHDGFALIAYKSGVPVIPTAVWGTETILIPGRRWPRQTVHIRYGAPMQFTPANGIRAVRTEMHAATETTMRAIANMLPAEYRGYYNDSAVESSLPSR